MLNIITVILTSMSNAIITIISISITAKQQQQQPSQPQQQSGALVG